MKTIMSSVLICIAAFSMIGCTSVKVCNSAGGMEVVQSEGGSAKVRADDECFGNWISVDDAVIARSAAGFAIASVRLRNGLTDVDDDNREDDFAMQYMFTWFDGNGVEMNADGAKWMRLTLHGGEAVTFSSTAADGSAVKYVLRLRHVR